MKKYNMPIVEMLVVSTSDILLSSGEEQQPEVNLLDNLALDDF